MRSRPHTSITHPGPDPAATRTRRSRGAATARRRTRVVEPIPHVPGEAMTAAQLYRAEKARRASNVDATLMAEAKRLYDEAVAESGKRRAGMRGAVIAKPARRAAAHGIAPAAMTDEDADDVVDLADEE